MTFLNSQLLRYLENKNAKRYFNYSATAFIATILLLFVMRPLALSILQTREDISENTRLVLQMDVRIKYLQNLQSQLDRNDKRFELIYIALPDSSSEEMIITGFNYIASIHQVSLTSIDFNLKGVAGNTEVSATEAPTELETASTSDITISPVFDQFRKEALYFSVTAAGTYENLLVFLKDINNLLRLVSITKVGLTTGEDSSDPNNRLTSGNLKISLEGQAFSLPGKQ